MYIINDACIDFNKPIPAEAMEKLAEFKDFFFEDAEDGTSSTLNISEAYGDMSDDLNKVVEILRPYGVAPLVGEYNRYYGDYEGYDVFTGERFESMDDVEYGGWLARDTAGKYDELIRAANDLVCYCIFHNKNLTKAQEYKLDDLKAALDALVG